MDTSSASRVIVVMTGAPDVFVARRLGRCLVDERLAACVNILPGVTSIYRWEGAVKEETEVMMLAKTTIDVEPALRARLVDLHPYDVPEVVSLAVTDGHARYLAWVGDEVRKP